MPPENQTIEFEGYFAEGVLGIFKSIRGFADLQDPTVISVSYELSDDAEPGQETNIFGNDTSQAFNVVVPLP